MKKKLFVEPQSDVAVMLSRSSVCVMSPGATIDGYSEDSGYDSYFD